MIHAAIQPGDCLPGCDRHDSGHHHPHQHPEERKVTRGRIASDDSWLKNVLRWTFGPSMCHVMTSMEVILLCASINNFVLVNLDRLLCLKFQQFPLRSNSTTSEPEKYKRIKIGIAICWVLAFIPAAPMWFSTKEETKWNCSFPFKNVSWHQEEFEDTYNHILRPFGCGQQPVWHSSSQPSPSWPSGWWSQFIWELLSSEPVGVGANSSSGLQSSWEL